MQIVNFFHELIIIFFITGAVPTYWVQTEVAPWESQPQPSSTKDEILARINFIEKQLEKEKKEKSDFAAKYHNLKQDFKSLKKKHALLKKLSARTTVTVNAIKNRKLTISQKKKAVHELFSPFFSKAMINWFLNSKKGCKYKKGHNWSNWDFTTALTIRRLSKKLFNYLRGKKLMALPCMETIRSHFSKFIIEEGHFHHVYSLLELMASSLSAKERIVSLMFDEVSTKADISLDATHDRVVGPHSQANVLMLRSIYGNLKVPIWAGFDTEMDKKILETAILAVEKAGFHVVSVCCDMGTKNSAVKNELGVTIATPWFKHPSPKRPDARIFWLHDVPHLLKLIRNHLLSKGFVLETGTKIGKPELQRLLDKVIATEGCQFSPAKKLTQGHLDVKHQDKQRVHTAAELLSNTAATCASELFPDDPVMQELAQFLSGVNNFFDIFNSTKEFHHSNSLGNAYGGSETANQDKFLEDFAIMVNNLRVPWNNKEGKKAALQEWQKGVLMVINVLKPLHQYLYAEYGIPFVMTYRLNQDALEQIFSILRAMGGMYTEFGSLEFLRRIRNLILGAGGDMSMELANVKGTEENLFSVEAILGKDLHEELAIEVTPDSSILLEVNPLESPLVAEDVTGSSRNSNEVEMADNDNTDTIDDLLSAFGYNDIDNNEENGKPARNVNVTGPAVPAKRKNDSTDLDLEDDFDGILGDFEGVNSVSLTLPQQMGLEMLADDLDTKFLAQFSTHNVCRGMNLSKEKLVEDLKVMENEFQLYHRGSKDGLHRTKNVTKNLVSRLAPLFPQYEQKLIKAFVISRTLERVKFIYRTKIRHEESARSKKKKINFAQSRPAGDIKTTFKEMKKKTAKKKPVKRLASSEMVQKKAKKKTLNPKILVRQPKINSLFSSSDESKINLPSSSDESEINLPFSSDDESRISLNFSSDDE